MKKINQDFHYSHDLLILIFSSKLPIGLLIAFDSSSNTSAIKSCGSMWPASGEKTPDLLTFSFS